MIQYVTARNFILQNIDTSTVVSIPSNQIHGGYVLLIKADWCPHCVSYVSVFKELSERNQHVRFLILETTKNEHMMKQWGMLINPAFKVDGYPTLIRYDVNGVPSSIIHDRFQLQKEL